MHLAHDLRVVGRGLLRAPGLTLLVVSTLGLAIGANSATFCLIDRVALRPLPVEKPEQLVMLTAQPLPREGPGYMMGGGKMLGMDVPLFQALRDGLSPMFTAMALRRPWRFTLSAEPSAIEITGEYVNAAYFRVLGLKALVGRTFVPPDDGQKDGPAIAVLNHGFWMRQFGGDPGVVNRTIRINNVPVTVVGVLGPGYTGMISGQRPELFLPLPLVERLATFNGPASARLAWDAPGVSLYIAVGRLRPEVERIRAERELRLVYQRLLDEALRHVTPTKKALANYSSRPPELVPAGTVGSAQAGASRSLEVPLRLLLGMTVFVLIVAAGNVANLLAARGAQRRHELAVSFALGARRWDLLRPRLLECVALALLSGSAALVLAAWTGDAVPVLLGLGNDLAGVNTRPDARVIVFTIAASIAAALGIWLASALAITRRRALSLSTTAAAAATGRRSGPRLRHLLVIVQVALSLALVCASALLGRSLWNVLSTDPGFDADRVVAFSVNPGAVGYESERLAGYAETLADRAKALPGVSRVALSSALPLSGGGGASQVQGPRQRAASAEGPYAEMVEVSADYFATTGLPIVAGRAFDARDGKAAPRVAIVNEALARLLVAQPPVIGEKLGSAGGPLDVEIVGVVRDARGRSLKVAPEPTLFRPLAQAGGYGVVNVLLRSDTPKSISAAAVADLVRRIDPGVAVPEFGSLRALARSTLLRERMLAGLSLVFAGLSAILAAMGIFGVASFNLTRRTREVGIRLALGASRGAVARMVLCEVAWLVVAGGAIGLALFLAGNRLLGSMLFEVSADDPLTIAAAGAGLAVVATLAGLLPARRAAKTNPVDALRAE
jgi:predicted permease